MEVNPVNIHFGANSKHGVAEDFAPSFTQKPQLRQEDEGNRLVFECKLWLARNQKSPGIGAM
ncbi:Unc-22p [Sarracenia purpurea var. burkii]